MLLIATVPAAVALAEVAACAARPNVAPSAAADDLVRSVVLTEQRRNFEAYFLFASSAHPDHPEARPVRFATNSEGFLTPFVVRPEAVRIAFIGGSTTECGAVTEQKRFPILAARLLEERLKVPVDGLNAGRSGSHAVHAQLVFVTKVLPYRPHIAVLMENINDLNALLLGENYGAFPAQRAVLSAESIGNPSRLVRESLLTIARPLVPNLLQLIRIATFNPTPLGHRSRTPSPELLARLRHTYAGTLRAFVASARAFGIKPVLMTQFNRFRDGDARMREIYERTAQPNYQLTWEQFVALYASFNDELRATAQNVGVPVVDLDRAVQPPDRLLYDFVHVNEGGSEVAAHTVADALAPLVAEVRP